MSRPPPHPSSPPPPPQPLPHPRSRTRWWAAIDKREASKGAIAALPALFILAGQLSSVEHVTEHSESHQLSPKMARESARERETHTHTHTLPKPSSAATAATEPSAHIEADAHRAADKRAEALVDSAAPTPEDRSMRTDADESYELSIFAPWCAWTG